MGQSFTPASLGFFMPAEWEPHAATWISWPRNVADWPGKFAPIPWVYGEIVRHLAGRETVRILVSSPVIEKRARLVLRRVGVDPAGVEFVSASTDRSWTRDFGPLFLVRETAGGRRAAIARLRFNGWAKYPNHLLDDAVPDAAARWLGARLLPVRVDGHELVLEGGSIDVNGAGTVLTTEECLLDPAVQVRNPGLDRAGWERALRESLGVRQVLWLGRGIAGDDTHGHIDDLCRFVDPSTVVLAAENDPADANYRPLAENRERLQGVRLASGKPLRVVSLPMPAPLYLDGQRLPASYANFYIANGVVLVPTFNDPADRLALDTMAGLFPGRQVIGIHAVDLVWGLGTLHCLTQQQPAGTLLNSGT